MRIRLEFAPDSTPVLRSRLTYGFQLFCAIYGHDPLFRRETGQADVIIRYGANSPGQVSRRCLYLHHLAASRPVSVPAPPPSGFARDGESTVLFYAPMPGTEPDWLGEIFEWVSCADEYSIAERDFAGRIPFAFTYAGRHHLDIRVPYAAVAMRMLQQALYRLMNRRPEPPACPVARVRHFVVSTHDVDYWPLNRMNGVIRLVKNAAITLALSNNALLSVRQAHMALRLLDEGRDPLDQFSRLVEQERLRGLGASYYFLPLRLHRRDANYSLLLPEIVHAIEKLRSQGFEVGVHGTYTSLDRPSGLAEEYSCFRRLGVEVLGGRQHWLRFTLDRLISALEKAGAIYDTSLGWSDRIGYRAGACFPFPPYNFEKEQPANFIELPMAIMDQALQAEVKNPAEWFQTSADLLAQSRRFGWGGISLLWHPAGFGGGWLSPEVGDVYWQLAERQVSWHDTWENAMNFVRLVRQRFVDVGMLSAFPSPVETGEEHGMEPAQMLVSSPLTVHSS